MRISDRELLRQITALEASHGASVKLREEVERLDITDHIADCYLPVHEDVVRGDHTFFNLPGGRGSGKSSYVSLEIVNQIMKDRSGNANAIVIRKYANTLRGSVFNQIQWAIDTLGVSEHWRSTVVPLQFIYETGQVIRFSGLDDPTKLKSLRPTKGYFKILWIEEFSEICGEVELRNLQQSVLRGGNRFTIFRSFNPPISSANWANQFIQKPDDRSLTIQTDYRMIPPEWLGELFLDEAERLKEINPRAYQHEFLGIPTGNGSEVFPNLEIRRITDEEIRKQEYFYNGLDFGFASDPTAFLRVAYQHRTDQIMIVEELYKRHCSNQEFARLFKELPLSGQKRIKISPVFQDVSVEYDTITADSADPRSIADLRSLGLKVRPCHKEPGCVSYRIRWLQHRKIVIDPERTPETAREFQRYCYVVDRKTGEITSELPDRDNHTIDSCAYALNDLIYKKRYTA